MMRSSAYNCFGVLMGISWLASCPRWPSLRGTVLPMITLFPSQGDFCATAMRGQVSTGGGREAQTGLHSPPFLTIVASAPSLLCLVLGRGSRTTARATCDLLYRDIDDWEERMCCVDKRRRSMLFWALVGGVVICVVLLDAFETIVLP